MTVKKLYVVGSGAMGSGIAQTAATHGIQVIMNDINEEFVAKGYNKIKKSLEKAVTKQNDGRSQRSGTCKPDYYSLAGRCQGC